jgi:hypothetical protein
VNDDEVMEWLSEDERLGLDYANDDGDYYYDPHLGRIAATAFRTLAETRRAAWATLVALDTPDEWSVERCPACLHHHVHHYITGRDAHEPGCVFATMPRPKPPSSGDASG